VNPDWSFEPEGWVFELSEKCCRAILAAVESAADVDPKSAGRSSETAGWGYPSRTSFSLPPLMKYDVEIILFKTRNYETG